MDIGQSQEAQNVAQQEAPESEEILDMQDIKRTYFASNNLDAAGTEIEKVISAVEAEKGKVIWSFDPAKDTIPEGFGLVIQPINQRDKSKGETVVIGVGIGIVPEMDILQTSPEGAEFIRSSVYDKLVAKLSNAFRAEAADSGSANIPVSIDDFITSQRAEGVLVAYYKLAKGFIKILKKKGLKLINEQLLRQTLQSEAFAKQHYPSIDQSIWVKILDSMINQANAENMSPGILIEWKETRTTAGLPEVQELSVDDFDF